MTLSQLSLTSLAAGAVIGMVSGLAVVLFQTWVNRRQERDRAKKDLIAELKQNQLYQIRSKIVRLEDDSYKRLRQLGFFSELTENLQNELQRLYAAIHTKNDWITHYNVMHRAVLTSQSNAVQPNQPPLETKKAPSEGMRDYNLEVTFFNIEGCQKEINDLINKILPQLGASTDR